MNSRNTRIEPNLTRRYQKNSDDEEFLATLNDILGPYQEASYEELRETYPTLHIIGAPRSGTTLLNQLVCSCLDVGYINNLIAAFWRAPVYGIRLSQKLLGAVPVSSYQSDFGRTRGVYEPHEFGYFWTSLLNYTEPLQKDRADEATIDWDRVRMVLLNISAAFGRPVVYKSFYLGWHLFRVQEQLPKTCFVWIRRRPTDTALSLLKLRREFLGSVEKWASFKPPEYAWLKERPYWEQVAGQIYYLERAIATEVERISGRNVLQVSYEDLCENPSVILDQVERLLSAGGGITRSITEPPDSFPFRTFDEHADEEARLVHAAVERFYSGDEIA